MLATRRRRKRQALRRRFAYLCMVALLGVAGWGGGLVWFVSQMPEEEATDIRQADAIVVLTGGQDRLSRGFDLLGDGLAGKLFISGVYRGLDVRELLKMSRQAPDELECCIELGYAAADTTGNALETARWASNNGVHSLILVTAHYHVPRSLLEFEEFMPGVHIEVAPVFPPNVHRDNWWRWTGTARLYAAEFNKYLLAKLRRLAARALAAEEDTIS
jgi:uncharacterized SAM-binding protein YcdF (DUF218 family)